MGDEDGQGRKHRVAVVAAGIVLLAGVVAVAVAVREDRSGGEVSAPVAPSTVSSPFVVGDVPDGYRLVRVGVGTQPPTFGTEHEYTLEPFTLLSADGTPDGTDLLAVSYTLGVDEYAMETQEREGGSDHASFDVDGLAATFTSGTDWADLTLKRNVDVWVRVSSATERSREELVAIAEQVPVPDVADRSFAPPLEDGFAGLRVVGSVDAHVVESQWPTVYPEVPLSPEGAHVASFEAPDDDRLVVRTLPGRAGDLDVIGRHPWTSPRRVGSGEVDGRPVVHLACDHWCVASATTSPSGDLVIAWASSLDHAALDEVLASVAPTDEAGWRRYAEEAFGGPGLRPDEGAEEVARGTAGEVEWLLQTVPTTRDADRDGTEPDRDGIEAIGIDRCLKLSDLTRACAGANGSGGPDGAWTSIADFETEEARLHGGPAVITLVAFRGYADDVVAVRAVGPAEPAVGGRPARAAFDVTVPVTSAPIGDGSFAVFDVDVGAALCLDPAPIEAETGLDPGPWARVSLVDANGDEVACLGIG